MRTGAISRTWAPTSTSWLLWILACSPFLRLLPSPGRPIRAVLDQAIHHLCLCRRQCRNSACQLLSAQVLELGVCLRRSRLPKVGYGYGIIWWRDGIFAVKF